MSNTPSSFAHLLKQSKFASYNPSIAQVYTTYNGHAHRGDWGLKRPLPMRKRNRALLVQAMDTREQQTEFRSGEPEVKMVKRWGEETKTNVLTDDGASTWGMQHRFTGKGTQVLNQLIDSEFSTTCDGETASEVLMNSNRRRSRPNLASMSEREFQFYIRHIRKIRPKFVQYVEKAISAEERSNPYLSTPKLMKKTDILHEFLSKYSQETSVLNPSSKRLEPLPHINGGLTYTFSNPFQTYLSGEPIPARIFHRNRQNERFAKRANNTMTVGVAGILAEGDMNRIDPGGSIVNWDGTNTKGGKTLVRITSAHLREPPEVVVNSNDPSSPPKGLSTAKLKVSVVGVASQGLGRNPYRPGSFRYCFEDLLPESISSRPRRPPSQMSFSERIPSRFGKGAAERNERAALLNRITQIIDIY